ncbi:MAG: glycosyltransferase family 39 protein [Bacteroidetes bacterium]|nr:glycosyltransferase family 39 protein [Bacteroidota bacterium]MCW5897247.1 glycosyltransferase family 39 protein [Bacteroidota bacterium]
MRWLRSYQDVLLIVLVGFILRVSLVGYLHLQGYTGDEREYVSLATKLAQGQPFIDSNGEWSTKAPLWPFLLSVVFRVLGDGLLAPHVLGCVLGGLAIWLGFVLTLDLSGRRFVALIAAAFIALYPGLVIYSTLLQTESLYIVFVLASFILLERQRKHPTIATGALIGILAGFATLTRAVFFGFFIFLIAVLLVAYRKQPGVYAGSLAVAIVAWLIVLTPWTIRNYNVHGEFVPISSWGGISLLLGNNPYSTGTWSSKPGFEEWFRLRAAEHNLNLTRSTETERSALGRKLAIEYVLSEPGNAATLALKKFYMHWIYPISNTDSDTRLQAVCVAGDMVMYVFAGFGLMTMGWKTRPFVPILLAVVFFTGMQVLLHCEARYRLPLMPVAAMFAAGGVALFADTKRMKEFFNIRRNRVVASSWVTVVGVVYAFTAWQFLEGSM